MTHSDDMLPGTCVYGGSSLCAQENVPSPALPGAESCDRMIHCPLCTVAAASSLVKVTEIGHFCCGRTECFSGGTLMTSIMDSQVPEQEKYDPKYVEAVKTGSDTSGTFRYHACRLVSMNSEIQKLIATKYTGVRSLLPTCFLNKIRYYFSSKSGDYFGTKPPPGVDL